MAFGHQLPNFKRALELMCRDNGVDVGQALEQFCQSEMPSHQHSDAAWDWNEHDAELGALTEEEFHDVCYGEESEQAAVNLTVAAQQALTYVFENFVC